MDEKLKLRIVLIFTIVYLIFFTVLALVRKNYEFLYYTFILVVLIIIVTLYHKKMHLTPHIIIGLAALGLLHVAGGNLYFNGTRLYEIYLIKSIFRYDHLVHSLGVFIATFVGYNVLKPYLNNKINHNTFLLALILILISMGVGAFNEVLEFGAVVFLGAAKQVGDYFNNAMDLFFNLIGAIIASMVILYYHKKQVK